MSELAFEQLSPDGRRRIRVMRSADGVFQIFCDRFFQEEGIDYWSVADRAEIGQYDGLEIALTEARLRYPWLTAPN